MLLTVDRFVVQLISTFMSDNIQSIRLQFIFENKECKFVNKGKKRLRHGREHK